MERYLVSVMAGKIIFEHKGALVNTQQQIYHGAFFVEARSVLEAEAFGLRWVKQRHPDRDAFDSSAVLAATVAVLEAN